LGYLPIRSENRICKRVKTHDHKDGGCNIETKSW
jgi:hypothetical protein